MALSVPALLAGGAVLVIGGVAMGVLRMRQRAAIRRYRERRIEEWTAIAMARGFEIVPRGDDVMIRGTVASRPFELTHGNFLGYGMDVENAMNLRVEDTDAKLEVSGNPLWPAGEKQPPSGDEAFDARFRVRANEEGALILARLGPDERRILVEHPELMLAQHRDRAWIRLPYRLDLASVDAACRLATAVWGQGR
jgi:hypothetical protein